MRFIQTRAMAALVATVVLGAGAGSLALQAQSSSASGKLVIHINTNAIGFGGVRVGQRSAPQTITLQNVGTAPMSVNSVTVGGAIPGDFQVVSTCGALPINATCTMTGTFTPSAQGPRAAMLEITASTPTAPYMMPMVGNGIDPNVPQPAAGPIDPRTGYPTYFSDGFNTLELCLDSTPPNDANGNPLPQTIDPLSGLLTPTMCLTPVPDPTRPPAVTDSPETTNMFDEHFWWSAGAEATPAGWKRAIIVMAQEAAFTAAPFAGNQSAFGRLRLRADGVPPGTYRFTHPFGSDVVTVPEGDDRIFETSDIGCFTSPCDYTQAVPGLSRIARFLQCTNAPIVVNGVEYLGDPTVECQVTGSPVNQNFFRVERVEANGSRTLLAQTDLFSVTGKRVSAIAPPPPTNRAPNAVDDAVSTAFNTPVTVAVLGNDTDPDLPGDSLRVTAVTQGAGGAVAINANGTVTYTPGSTFSGPDSFQYSISDAAGLTDSAIVTVTVGAPPPVNRNPIAGADTASTTQGVAITITNLLANDSDPDGDPIAITAVAAGTGGSVSLGAGNAVTFTPAATFVGTAAFTYTVGDGRGGSATGNVSVSVAAAPQPPAGAPTRTALVSAKGTGAQTTAPFSTSGPTVLVALVASDGPTTGANNQLMTISGAGLAWTRVARANTSRGVSEIWTANAAASLTGAQVTSTQSVTVVLGQPVNQMVTVAAFSNASGVGATNIRSGATGAPTVSLVTTSDDSLIYGVGNDFDRAVARTVGTGQVKVDEFLAPSGDTMWVQARTAPSGPAGSTMTLNDTAPTTDQWNFAIVEIKR